MKQVPITDAIRQKLTAAAGDGVDTSNLAVYEATALNSNPVRKRHPLYKSGIHTKQFMTQMSAALNKESLPMQIQHDKEPLPVGRVFYAEVVDNQMTAAPELRALFWVDKTNADLVNKIDNGTVDQVSVSILPKSALCSSCGFDFFSDTATLDNIWDGTCPDGHVMGTDGAHAIMNDLESWNEMSLVGKGGIPGARIASAPERRLTASGSENSLLTLNLSSNDLEKPSMDMTALVTELTTSKAQGLQLTATVASKDTEIAALNAKVAEAAPQAAKVTELTATVAAKDTEIATLKAAVVGVGKHLLAISGDATTALSEDVSKVVEFITEKTKTMKLSFAPAGTHGAENDKSKTPERTKASSAFTAPK